MCCKSKEHLRITKVLFLTKILILLIFVSSSFGGTVGNTTIFGSTSTSSNRRAMPFTMTEDGVITSISMYHVGGSGDMILGVYDDNGGLPNNQLGVTLSTGVNGTAGFQTINLISPAPVSSGQTIWLAWVYQSIPGIAYETGSPGRADAGEGWSGGMPDPYGSSTTGNYIYSIYATYTTNQFPTAVISANPTSGNPPLTVNLDATGSSDPDSDPLTYDWQFGDGGSNTSAITSHEYTSAGIYTVTLTVDDGNGGTDVATTKIYVGVTVLFEADFNSDAQGFTYADDAFRGTSQPSYASGAYTASGGNGGSGGVEVTLGAPSSQVNNMSGGWSYTFNLAQAGDVELSLMYNLTQSPTYESDEHSQSLVSIDGTLYGTPPNDYIAQIEGDGQGSGEPPITTGWQEFTTTLPSLSAGNHTITVGGFNNKATLPDEYTTIVMDDIVLAGAGGAATVTVTSPNGGESWQVSSSQTISWTSTGSIANVKIEYYNGFAWSDIIASTPNDGSHPWTTPATEASGCLIRISDASDASINDQSDGTFSIPPLPFIYVILPNGGENWIAGTRHLITWTSSGSSNNVRIEYYDGSAWSDVIASTPNDGSHYWTTPSTGATGCLIRISDASNASINDQSDGTFSIVDDSNVPYNRMLSITGTLYDEYGNPVGYPDPVDINVLVRLATDITAGEIVYTETFYEENEEAVTVDNGFFVARLGSGTSTDDLRSVLSANENLFVEITVEEQDPPDVLLPRTPLTAGAFTLTGPPALSGLNLNTIHGSGDPNDSGIEGRVGMYYIDDETGITWLRVNSKWILLE